jgi:hypothetical protein
MKKDDLRKVMYNITTKPYEGYFHLWLKKMDEFGSEYAMAVIEDKETGRMHEIPRDGVRFEN